MIISRWFFAVVCVLVAIAAACTADADEPSTLPDTAATADVHSPTPIPTPTPTVEPPVEPPNAHEYSAEGVEAFTRYAIDVINHAYRTNDVTPLKQIMTPECEFCVASVSRLTTIAEAGGRIEGGQLLPEAISVVGPAEGVQTSAGVELVVTASRTTDGEGQVKNTELDRDRYFIFNLTRKGDTWRLAEVLSSESPST